MGDFWPDDDLDYWRLCDELSVYEAALLTVGQSPGKLDNIIERLPFSKQPRGYEAAKTAIRNALRSGKIKGTIKPELDDHVEGDPVPIIDSVNLYSSRIEVESLKTWLIGRGFQRGFFFPNPVEAPGYLDPANSRYAPKLVPRGAMAPIGQMDPGGGMRPRSLGFYRHPLRSKRIFKPQG